MQCATHCLGAHTEAFQFASDASDDDADDGADAVAPDDAASQRNSVAAMDSRMSNLPHANIDGSAFI